MYSWGLNADNQLGHGKMADNGNFLSHPRHIDALAGQHITQVNLRFETSPLSSRAVVSTIQGINGGLTMWMTILDACI